jgi:hypothetical protein
LLDVVGTGRVFHSVEEAVRVLRQNRSMR